jgi:prepilin-type N-terminal cleavage/methylation domain-containing protein
MRRSAIAPSRFCSRGFTLIEITIVIALLLFLALLVVPNMVAIKRTRDLRVSEAALLRLPAEAREEAKRSGVAVTLRVEDNQTLILEKTTTTTDTTARTATVSEETEEFKRLTLKEGLQLDTIQTGSESRDATGWTWKIYPDGTTGTKQTSQVIVTEGDVEKTIILAPTGIARWQDSTDTQNGTNTTGQMGQEERWSAGELEKRA